MLVIISDMHMEEESSLTIPSSDGNPPLTFSRNLSPKAYRKIFADLAEEAKRNNVKEMTLVLAGDVFELYRTGLWFVNNPDQTMPFVSNGEVDEGLERKILEILDEIVAEPENGESLEAIRLLQEKIYYEGKQPRGFPVERVTVHYLPGNHDRLANSTPAIRRKVRQLLGMPALSDPFPTHLFCPDEKALIRHGHEYDRFNFAYNYQGDTPLFHVKCRQSITQIQILATSPPSKSPPVYLYLCAKFGGMKE